MRTRLGNGTAWWVAAALALSAIACGRRAPVPQPHPVPAAPAVRVLEDGRVRRVPLERYVRGSIEGEIWVPLDEPLPVVEKVVELQALLARTFALSSLGRHDADGADLCATTHCQIYRTTHGSGPRASLVDAVVARSAGLIVAYDGRPALTLFHADCGGATTGAHEVWGGIARPYLVGAPDPYCERRRPGWEARLEPEALARTLDADPALRVGGRVEAVRVIRRDSSGRALEVAVTGATTVTVRAEHLRARLARAFGAGSFRSTRFDVAREGSVFVFRGRGAGHGAGLCQRGALDRLRAGHSVRQVLDHYFPGVRLLGT